MTRPPGKPVAVRWRLDCQKKRIARKRRARAIYNISFASLISGKAKIIISFGVRTAPKILIDFDSGPSGQAKSQGQIRIDFQDAIRTIRDGHMELHISVPVCDRRPAYIYEMILYIINMDCHVIKWRLVIVKDSILIRVYPGFR